MNLKQMTVLGKSRPSPQPEPPNAERCLTLLVEGMTLNMPEIDGPAYKLFREAIGAQIRQIPDRMSDSETLPVINEILHEFEDYRNVVDTALRDREAGWRTLAAMLLKELLGTLGIDPAAPSAAPLVEKIANLSTGDQIQAYCALVEDFLRPGGGNGAVERAAPLKQANHSIANDNAAGLLGGGAAQKHLEKVMESGGVGFVVLFRLSCLDMIGERFGMEAVQDSLMAVAAFITQKLRGDDAVFHWSDSSLLAILETPATEPILAGVVQRIVNSNRDITIHVGDRNVMLRIPLTFELTPISRFRSSQDLLKLSRAAPVSS
jgi:hypothetical protein